VFPPLPHGDPRWGRAEEVGRGSVARAFTMHHTGTGGKSSESRMLHGEMVPGNPELSTDRRLLARLHDPEGNPIRAVGAAGSQDGLAVKKAG
jgi:hypothetical protein